MSVHHCEESVLSSLPPSIDLHTLPFLSPSISQYTLCICTIHRSIMRQSITVKNLSFPLSLHCSAYNTLPLSLHQSIHTMHLYHSRSIKNLPLPLSLHQSIHAMHLSHPVVLPIPSIMHQTITVKNLPAAKAVCICVSPTHSLCINLCLKNLSFPPSIDQYALSTIHPPIHHSSVHHREESVLPCLFPAFHQYAVCFYLIHPSIMHQSVTAKNLSVLPSVDLYALCACLIHPSIMHQSTL